MKIRHKESKIIQEAKARHKMRQAKGTMLPEPHIEWVATEEEAEAWFKRDKPKYRIWRDAQGNSRTDAMGRRVMQLVIAIPEAFRVYHENPARFKDAHGGRGSAKSMSFARLLMIRVIWRGWRLLAAREIQDSIQESSKGELESAIADLCAESYCLIMDKEIRTAQGGRVAFIGLAKTGDKIKGYSKFDAVWIEEADTVSRNSWKRLIPTIRKTRPDGTESEIWLTWNPSSTIADTWKRFVSECIYPEFREDGAHYLISREVNFDQNPFFGFTPLRDDERFMKEANYDEWLHVYGGQPVGAMENAIIKPLWIKAAMDLHQLLTEDYEDGAHIVGGFDPGGTNGSGSDPSALSLMQNNVLCYLDEFKMPDPVAASDHVFDIAAAMDVSEVRYDVIGVGLGAKGAVRKRNEEAEVLQQAVVSFLPFDASGAVLNPDQLWAPKRRMFDHFMNAKAQAWGMLARRFFHAYLVRKYWDECLSSDRDEKIDYVVEKLGEERMQQLISIDTIRIAPKLLEKLEGELASPTWVKMEGKMQVETKESMKKRGIASTNLADAVMMNCAPMKRGIFADA